jgi:uncharacterized protein YecE (DUF72 family)
LTGQLVQKSLRTSSQPEALQKFLERAKLLDKKLGPLLYQLPPSLQKDLDLLEAFIKLLPKEEPPSLNS